MIGTTETSISTLSPTVLFFSQSATEYRGWIRVRELADSVRKNAAMALPAIYIPFAFTERSIRFPTADLVFAITGRTGTERVPLPSGQLKKQKIEAAVEQLGTEAMNEMLRTAREYQTERREASSIRGGFTIAMVDTPVPARIYHAAGRHFHLYERTLEERTTGPFRHRLQPDNRARYFPRS